MDIAVKILRQLGIKNATPEQQSLLRSEISKQKLEAANEALQEERKRCYDVALHCHNSWKKSPPTENDICIAAEVIGDAIQKGFRPKCLA